MGNTSELRRDYREEIDRLVRSYNFPDRWYADIFVDLLEAAIRERHRPTVLDVGCGSGICGDRKHQRRLRSFIGRYIGVEPDKTVPLDAEIFDTVHAAFMEDASIPKKSIDIAYAAMVAEHVADPEAFLHSIKRCLRPGGIFLICTPNGSSYFGRICSVVRFVGIEDWLLRLIRGTEKVDRYHYPTMYRMNNAGRLHALGQHAGLGVKVGHTEPRIASREYFPGPLKPIWSLLKLKRKIWKSPASLTHIIAIFDKPTIDHESERPRRASPSPAPRTEDLVSIQRRSRLALPEPERPVATGCRHALTRGPAYAFLLRGVPRWLGSMVRIKSWGLLSRTLVVHGHGPVFQGAPRASRSIPSTDSFARAMPATSSSTER